MLRSDKIINLYNELLANIAGRCGVEVVKLAMLENGFVFDGVDEQGNECYYHNLTGHGITIGKELE